MWAVKGQLEEGQLRGCWGDILWAWPLVSARILSRDWFQGPSINAKISL